MYNNYPFFQVKAYFKKAFQIYSRTLIIVILCGWKKDNSLENGKTKSFSGSFCYYSLERVFIQKAGFELFKLSLE